MSDGKPFWQGKTTADLKDTRVTVTFSSGATLTGQLNRSGFLRLSDNYAAWRPFIIDVDGSITGLGSIVESVEPADGPDYERVDSLVDVRKGDVVVTPSGNRYTALGDADTDGLAVDCSADGLPFTVTPALFDHALRLRPELPDASGLWVDRDGDVWVVSVISGKVSVVRDDGDWGLYDSSLSIDDESFTRLAPFHPYSPEDGDDVDE